MFPIALLLMLAAPSPQGAPAECSDDQGIDRCNAAVQARTRKKFGVPTLEELASAQTQVMRSFFVNGYGGDEPLVTFIRSAGREPEVIVTAVNGAGKPIEMRALVPVALWEKLESRSELFDRTLAGGHGAGGCLHSWVVTVEAASRMRGEPALRRKTQDACGDGLAIPFAFALAEAAVSLIPACTTLDPRQHRNDVTRLATCATLEGDRAAAALALNEMDRSFLYSPQSGAAEGLMKIHENAEIEWPGEPAVQGFEARDAWTRRMAMHNATVDRIVGETADRVRIEVTLDRLNGGGIELPVLPPAGQTRVAAAPPQSARGTMIWVRDDGLGFRMKSLKVEPFKTATSAAAR